ncbi:MAG: hypothetical protein ISR77_11810 [Pirellulaceae bacterium]|nr:hypothetical protein [Pirellulaceae bacterium]
MHDYRGYRPRFNGHPRFVDMGTCCSENEQIHTAYYAAKIEGGDGCHMGVVIWATLPVIRRELQE